MPARRQQQKQIVIRMIIPAKVPITIPAMAPPESLLPPPETGTRVPVALAEAGTEKGWVVVVLAVVVIVWAPEVGRRGAEYEDVA